LAPPAAPPAAPSAAPSRPPADPAAVALKEKMLTTSKMLGGASQIVSTIRVICNGK
jgi:hypothetical protein